jgi:hypothetical protein
MGITKGTKMNAKGTKRQKHFSETVFVLFVALFCFFVALFVAKNNG